MNRNAAHFSRPALSCSALALLFALAAAGTAQARGMACVEDLMADERVKTNVTLSADEAGTAYTAAIESYANIFGTPSVDKTVIGGLECATNMAAGGEIQCAQPTYSGGIRKEFSITYNDTASDTYSIAEATLIEPSEPPAGMEEVVAEDMMPADPPQRIVRSIGIKNGFKCEMTPD